MGVETSFLVQTFIAVSTTLALSMRFIRIGLFMLIVGFLAQTIFSYWVNYDPLIGFFSVLALIGALHEFIKSIRNKSYRLDKRTRLIISSVIIILGAWLTSLGMISPFLIAGLVALIFIVLEKRRRA